MPRKNFPITIDQLIKAAQDAKKKFGGKKYVLLSNDEEGNGYHECYYGFSDGKDMLDPSAGISVPWDLDPAKCVTLG